MEEQKVNQLHSEVSDLEKSLNELKTTTLSSIERKTKENEVKDKAEKIKGQIDNLSSEERIDARIVAETERADLLLKSCADTLNLQTAISVETTTTVTTSDKPTASTEASNSSTIDNSTNAGNNPEIQNQASVDNSTTTTEVSDKTPNTPAVTPASTPDNTKTPTIENPVTTPAANPASTAPENPIAPTNVADNGKKGFFGRVGDSLGNMWNDVTTKDKWKEQPGKNLLYVGGALVTGYGLYKGIKGLWNRAFGKKKDKKEESDEGNSDNKESKDDKKDDKDEDKPFWKTGWGKFLKWTGIGAGSGLAIYGLGKRLGRRGTEGATGRDSDKEKYESYEEAMNKPENKEKFENYEGLGDKVDNVYQEIYGRELKSGYEDELEMKRISEQQSKGTKFYKGIVPYCLDNQYKSVDGILGQNSSFKTALNEGLEGMINFVKGAGGNFLQLFADCYLEFLPSWLPFKGMAGSLSDKIDQWKIKNQDAEKEMQYFFRQSIRVQTYLFQKKDQLTKKIVKDAAQKYGKKEEEIWDDQDLFDKYVAKDPQYQNFLNSPTHSAVSVLAQNNLFDNHIDEDLKNQVSEIDKDRNRILGCNEGEKDIIESINEKKQKSETLDANDDKKLGEACDGMLGSMDNIIEAAEDSALNIYEDLTRLGDANLREYLEKSGLDKMFESYKQILLAKKQELLNGKLSNEDKIALAETINAMLALKKEAELGQFTIEKDYDEYGNIIWRIPGFLTGSVKNLIKGVGKLIHGDWGEGLAYIGSGFVGTGGAIALVGGVRCLIDVKTGKRIASFGGKMAFSPVWATYKAASCYRPLRDFGHRINPLKYRGKKGAEVLLQDLFDGRVSLDRAGKIIKRRCYSNFGLEETRDAWRNTFNTFGNKSKDIEGFDTRKFAFDCIVNKKRGNNGVFLNRIKEEPGLYDDLVKKWDTSPDIRRAVMNNGGIEDLKNLSKSTPTTETAEIATDVKKEFEASIKKAVGKLEATANKKAVQPTINELNALLNKITDEEEMKAFSRFINEGFEPKFIPELQKIFAIDAKVFSKSDETLGQRLKKCLTEGKYSEFKGFLKNPEFKKYITIDTKLLVDNFDTVLRKFGSLGAKATENVLKSAMKVIIRAIP